VPPSKKEALGTSETTEKVHFFWNLEIKVGRFIERFNGIRNKMLVVGVF